MNKKWLMIAVVGFAAWWFLFRKPAPRAAGAPSAGGGEQFSNMA